MKRLLRSRAPFLRTGLCGLLAAPVLADTGPESVVRRDLLIEKIDQGFKPPPAEARPFVRWWWNNDQVAEAEILRELDLLKAAGIGGVES